MMNRDVIRRHGQSTQISNISELSQLHHLLSTQSISCPTYDLIQCYSRCWKNLPEDVKSGSVQSHNGLVESTLKLVKSSYKSLLDLLPRSESPAILDGNSKSRISHHRLHEFVQSFRIPQYNESRIVAVALPNGALLAVASVAVMTYHTLAPLNVSSTNSEQFKSDLLRSGARCVLVLKSDVERLGLAGSWPSQHDIRVLIVEPAKDLTFQVSSLLDVEVTESGKAERSPETNGPDDTSLILLTSGTAGTQKIVSFNLHTIISGVTFVGSSWKLSKDDVCLNMMPLNHIGGILRNLLAPILMGGSTICCSSFDQNLFWDIIEDKEVSPTWYYGSPSMHIMILEEAENRSSRQSRMRMVCNAAGGLLPSLAERLRELFQCSVFPSYGMTECMPISAPPLDYKLERPGTSGISVGPEIIILDDENNPIQSGLSTVGRICVRGAPTFSGYLVDGKIDKSAFTPQGWFDTGDLGYMDDDRYLYVTGRSKEVINRGGELISPFEIEEAVINATTKKDSCIFGKVADCMAFSAPHEMLQEVVGLIIVTTNKPRPDLRQIQEALKSQLHATKIPVVLVYMQDLPKRNGKLCRIRMAQRLGLGFIRPDSPATERHLEAICPPLDSDISVTIQNQPCDIDRQQLLNCLGRIMQNRADITCSDSVNPWTGLFDVALTPISISKSTTREININNIKKSLRLELDGLLIPGSLVVKDNSLSYLEVGLTEKSDQGSQNATAGSSVESRLREIYSRLLSIPPTDIPLASDFWDLGGDSLRAGRLLSAIRKDFKVRIPIDKLFTFSSIQDVACIIEDFGYASGNKEKSAFQDGSQSARNTDKSTENSYNSTSFFTLLLHTLPLTTIAPSQKAIFWVVFLKTWGQWLQFFRNSTASSHFLSLIFSMFTARVFLAVISPVIGITAKWLIIGRYEEGLYSMWSPYQTRIWLADKITESCGMGIFQYFNWSRVLYHRLLGAKIGRNVIIQGGTTLGEHDLLNIGDDVELDRCVCRGLAAEKNSTIFLGRVKMGKGSGAGLKSIVAPGTEVPEGVCLGPNSSSWEWSDATNEINAGNFDQLSSRKRSPHWLLWLVLGFPTVLIIHAVSCLPWIIGLYGLNASDPPDNGDMVLFVITWFASPSRIGYHFLARTLHVLLGPIVYLGQIIAMKKILNFVFGKMKPTFIGHRSQIDLLRLELEHELLHDGIVGEVAAQFGTHYEITSLIYRLLGAKIGRRVYWPGNGPSFVGSYDFLEVGDDVVFGSRAYIITSDGLGSELVQIGDGAMVADRVVILPGCKIGERCVLGSGTLAERDGIFLPDSTWIGSKAGGAVCLSSTTSSAFSTASSSTCTPGTSPFPEVDNSFIKSPSDICWDEKALGIYIPKPSEPFLPPHSLDSCRSPSVASNTLTNNSFTTSSHQLQSQSVAKVDNTSPFGRAFYFHLAPYKVLSLCTITVYSIFTNILISIYWNIPTILSLQFLFTLSQHSFVISKLFKSNKSFFRPAFIYITMFSSFSVLTLVFSVMALAICISAKWIILGRRKPGNYDWDKSSYCQRWQILLTIERIRRDGSQFSSGGLDILALLSGTQYLVTYYRWLGAKIGRNVALFCGGRMTLPFTEPDLLTLGDNVCVDDASLVAHINSRGNFQLNELQVGNGCALRTGSRLLSGAAMGNNSVLMEHTLVMAGEEVEEGDAWQGWPAEPGSFDQSQRILWSKDAVETESESEDECPGLELAAGFLGFLNVSSLLRRKVGSIKTWFRSNDDLGYGSYERMDSRRYSKHE